MSISYSPQIALKGRLVESGFRALIQLLSPQDIEKSMGLTSEACEEELSRFRLWAGNIGTLQDQQISSSLEYRLRDVKRVENRVANLLNQMVNDLKDGRSILECESPNHRSIISYVTVTPHENAEEVEGSELLTEERSEIHEIFNSLSDNISELFKISMLVRKATPCDWYLKAITNLKDPFESQYDIAHVGQKYLKLNKSENAWLKEKLGRAITQRREFLRYAREHHDELSVDVPVSKNVMSPKESGENRPLSEHPSTKARSTDLVPTLLPSTLENIEVSDEDKSTTSYAIPADLHDERIAVVPLAQVSRGQAPFECPYCWQLVNFEHHRSWKKHVLQDMRPYLCTFPDCNSILYSDITSWFDHELKTHRLQWKCQLCSLHSGVHTREELEDHLQHRHGNEIVQSQLPLLLDISSQPVEYINAKTCPFCDTWEAKPEVETEAPMNKTTVVKATEFKNHVGRHMESLALFALPIGHEENERDFVSFNSVNALRQGRNAQDHTSRQDRKRKATSESGNSSPLSYSTVNAAEPTSLKFAAAEGLEEETKGILGLHPNISLEDKYDALLMAGRGGHRSTVDALLTAISQDSPGPDIKEKDTNIISTFNKSGEIWTGISQDMVDHIMPRLPQHLKKEETETAPLSHPIGYISPSITTGVHKHKEAYWHCDECGDGPIGIWQPACPSCSHRRCSACRVEAIEQVGEV